MADILKYTPFIPLSEFIDYLYVDRDPHGQPAIKEYIEPAHPRWVAGTAPQKISGPASRVKGVFTQPLPQTAALPYTIGIRFKPYGLYTGFDTDGTKTANQVVPGTMLFSAVAEQQIAELTTGGDHDTTIAHIQNILFQNLKPKPILHELTEMVDALLVADLTNNSQKHLASSFERTPKSFIALFKKAIGITPLQYLHIHKVAEAKRIIRAQPHLPLTDIGYELGFYDQAHFTRVFKKHTGYSPLQFKMLRADSPVNSVQSPPEHYS